MIVDHLKDKKTSVIGIGAYNAAMNFLKVCVAEFSYSDVEFSPFFRTEMLLSPINIDIEEVDMLNEGPIIDPNLGYV